MKTKKLNMKKVLNKNTNVHAKATSGYGIIINFIILYDSPMLTSRQKGSILFFHWQTDRSTDLCLPLSGTTCPGEQATSISDCSSNKLFFFLLACSLPKNRQSPVADQSVESSPFWALGNPGFL